VLSVAEGDGVAEAEGDAASSSEPESGEEAVLATPSSAPARSAALDCADRSGDEDADGAGSAEASLSAPSVPFASFFSSPAAPSLAEADGVGEAEEASLSFSSAATQSLYSSAVRLLAVGTGVLLLSASASEDVKPSPTITAVGIAAMAIALPAGMWNRVNSGFLGAA
jgi:hypothetical protein